MKLYLAELDDYPVILCEDNEGTTNILEWDNGYISIFTPEQTDNINIIRESTIPIRYINTMCINGVVLKHDELDWWMSEEFKLP